MSREGLRRDSGEMLIELLVSVMLLGLVGAAMVGSLLVLTASSVYYEDEVSVQNTLFNWSETVTRMPYVACVTAGGIPAAPDIPEGYSTTVVSIGYWDGSDFVGSCTPGTDLGLQRVTLQVGAPLAGYPAFTKDLDTVIRKRCVSGC